MKGCIITAGCSGYLRKDPNQKKVFEIPVTPPEVPGVADWVQRKRLANHIQDVKSAVWLVKHNLGVVPTIHVFVDREVNGVKSQTQVIPSKTVVLSPYTMEVFFDRPESGIAQCTSQSSAVSTRIQSTAEKEPVFLSGNGTLTFATLDLSPLYNLAITYSNATSAVTIEYAGGATTNIGAGLNSPWSGHRYVFVEGKKYAVRELNISTTYPAPEWFSSNRVQNGMEITIPKVKSAKQVLFLMGRPPFQVTDKISSSYVDAYKINNTLSSAYYSAGNILCTPGIVSKTYPYIFSINE